MNDDRLGPTYEDDEGELVIAITRDDDMNIRIDFGKPVAWLAMSHQEAIGFALLLLKRCGISQVLSVQEDDV